jgi:hypothetical protein
MAASGSACSSNFPGRDEEDLVDSPVLRARIREAGYEVIEKISAPMEFMKS